MASAEVNAADSFALPPGAANVEDDVRAWEAQERRAKWKLMIVRVLLAIVLLALWEYGTDRWFDALWFSSPLRIARHFLSWAQDDLLSHLVITLRETFIGYTCGTLLGIATGTLLARFAFLGKVLDPFILALNGIPRIALAPLFIIWFGIGEPSKIVLAGLLAFFLCFYATLSGLRSVDAAYISIARVMGATERQTFFKVVLPAASPWIITAMKVSVPFALVGAIVGEFMAATAGLGLKIQLYTAQFDTTGAVTGVLVLMVVVVMFNTASTVWKHMSALAPGNSGTAGRSNAIDEEKIAMTELRSNRSLVPPRLRARNGVARDRRAGDRACARADQGEDHAAGRKPELHADLRRARQGLLQGGRHRSRGGASHAATARMYRR